MEPLSEALPDAFWHGVEQFNQGEFYACHDTLEALWIEAAEPDKKFYQGILQVAVALYHLSNQNWRGAVILMGEGMNRLRNYQPSYAGIDTEGFLTQTAQVLDVLQQAGPDQVTSIVQRLGLRPSPKEVTEDTVSSVSLDSVSVDPKGSMPEGFESLSLPSLHTARPEA